MPQGVYQGMITEHGLSETSTGKPQIWLRIEVKVNESDPKESRKVYWVLTDKTIDFIADKLVRIGFHHSSFGALANGDADLRGKVYDWYCRHDTWNGETRERWDLAREDTGHWSTRDEQAIRDLDARFAASLKPQMQPPKDTNEKQENIPF